MSIRGSITVECDRRKCQAELVIEGEDATVTETRHGLSLALSAAEWRQDDEGYFWCPQCQEENPRVKGEDDGREYADPRDAKAERL